MSPHSWRSPVSAWVIPSDESPRLGENACRKCLIPGIAMMKELA
jgi:hypothetical protein